MQQRLQTKKMTRNVKTVARRNSILDSRVACRVGAAPSPGTLRSPLLSVFGPSPPPTPRSWVAHSVGTANTRALACRFPGNSRGASPFGARSGAVGTTFPRSEPRGTGCLAKYSVI